jgi:hypothetical protein
VEDPRRWWRGVGDTCITTLYRAHLDGSEKTKLADVVGYPDFIVDGDWIYYSSGNELYRANTDGSGKQKIADNCSRFIVAEGYIFVRHGGTAGRLEQYDTKIIRYNLDGTDETILIENDRIVFSPIFTDNEYLYYTLYFGGVYFDDGESLKGMQLHRMKFDGTDCQTIIEYEGHYVLPTIVLKDGFIYYSRNYIGGNYDSMGEIYKIRSDGTDCEKIRGEAAYSGIDFDLIGDSIFYTTSHGGALWGNKLYSTVQLWRLSLNGGFPLSVYSNGGSEYFSGYFVHGHKIYVVTSP